jgi:hypothetical protein
MKQKITRKQEHDPEKQVPVSRLREAVPAAYTSFDASAGEGRSDKIMLTKSSLCREVRRILAARRLRPQPRIAAKNRSQESQPRIATKNRNQE